MKTLNITLVMTADTYEEADLYGKLDLMEFAKIVGYRSGSTLASCEGETKHVAGNQYEVKAKMQIDGNANATEVIQEAQLRFNLKPRIISSTIFVSEEKKPEPVQKPRNYEPVTCEACGQIMVKGYENVINPGTEDEYYLCERCYTDAVNDSEVKYQDEIKNLKEQKIEKLAKAGITPTSMMDISDGLSSELMHICTQSNVGCRIYEERLPIDYQTAVMAEEFNMNVSTCALNGGEDYELLFTVPLTLHDKVSAIKGVKVIGHITKPELGCGLITRDGQEFELKAQGWNPLREK